MRITLLLLFACSPRVAKTFDCDKAARWEGGPRECEPHDDECKAPGGCFQREKAHCFPYQLAAVGDVPAQPATLCAPTEQECQQWHRDRGRGALGPCMLASPDEYLETRK